MHGSRFTGQQGVQGTRNVMSLKVSLPAWHTQILNNLGCVSVEDEVAKHETKTFPLPMGIERKDKCMGAGL